MIRKFLINLVAISIFCWCALAGTADAQDYGRSVASNAPRQTVTSEMIASGAHLNFSTATGQRGQITRLWYVDVTCPPTLTTVATKVVISGFVSTLPLVENLVETPAGGSLQLPLPALDAAQPGLNLTMDIAAVAGGAQCDANMVYSNLNP